MRLRPVAPACLMDRSFFPVKERKTAFPASPGAAAAGRVAAARSLHPLIRVRVRSLAQVRNFTRTRALSRSPENRHLAGAASLGKIAPSSGERDEKRVGVCIGELERAPKYLCAQIRRRRHRPAPLADVRFCVDAAHNGV